MNTFERTAALVMDRPDPPPPPPRGAVEPPRLTKFVLGAVALIGIAVVVGLLPRLRQRAATADRTRELAVRTVLVVNPRPATPGPALPLPAELKPMTEATLYGRASGYVKRLHVDLGSRVEAGQLLAEIDTPDLEAELVQARAQLAESEAARGLAEQTARRWAELLNSQSVSAQENAEKQADFALKAATVEAARAKVQRLEDLKGFNRVVAPFAGTITARNTDVGDLISSDTPHALFQLADTRRLRVFVRVPQTLAALAAVGTRAGLTLNERPGRVFPATVVRSAGALDPGSRTLLVELEVDNATGEIFSGAYGQVRLDGIVTNAVLGLPSNALIFRADGPQVGIVKDDQTVALRPVTLGRDFGRELEILGGVSATDRVILNPPDSLAPGASVRVAAPATPPETN